MLDILGSKKRLISILAPVIAGSIFIALACINLTSSIWFDEAYSAYLVRGNFLEIWELTAKDVHPPFYYFCLKIWSSIFGTSDFAMRFMSVFFGGLSIIVVFQLIKKWFGLKVASITSLILSVSPMFIRYGQEMRMYTLLIFIIVLATYVLDLAISSKKRSIWIIYGILVSLGMWTHYFSAFFWMAQLAYIIHRSGGIKETIKNSNIIFAYILSVILYIPWLPSFLKQSASVQGGFWIGEVTLNTPINYLSESIIYQESKDLKSWAIMPVIILIAMLIYFSRRVFKKSSMSEKKKIIFILFCIILPPVMLLLFSLPPLKPMFVNRYTTYSVVFLWAFMGIILGITLVKKISKLLYRLALIASITSVSIMGIINVETRNPNGYIKDILSLIWQVSDQNIPILPAGDMDYYDAVFYSSDKYPVYFVEAWTDYRWDSILPIKQYRHNLVENFSDFANQHKEFWYIIDTTKDESNLKENNQNYRVANKIVNEHHIAIKFEKI